MPIFMYSSPLSDTREHGNALAGMMSNAMRGGGRDPTREKHVQRPQIGRTDRFSPDRACSTTS
jgi:hypothetical protein